MPWRKTLGIATVIGVRRKSKCLSGWGLIDYHDISSSYAHRRPRPRRSHSIRLRCRLLLQHYLLDNIDADSGTRHNAGRCDGPAQINPCLDRDRHISADKSTDEYGHDSSDDGANDPDNNSTDVPSHDPPDDTGNQLHLRP